MLALPGFFFTTNSWAQETANAGAARLATVNAGARPADAGNAPAQRVILFFGDSITAGYGLSDPAAESYPALIQKQLQAQGWNSFSIVNAGVSGDTSAGGLRRIDWLLRQRPVDIFVLELGANDGLRGVPTEETRRNLQAILDKVKAKNPDVRLIIAGMMLPPSFGPEYTQRFRAIFPDLAKANHATLIPFLLEGVGGSGEFNQPDGVHPNAAGHRILAETTWKILQPLLAE